MLRGRLPIDHLPRCRDRRLRPPFRRLRVEGAPGSIGRESCGVGSGTSEMMRTIGRRRGRSRRIFAAFISLESLIFQVGEENERDG